MYPRLFLSRNLLKNDGVIFISIDDNEVDNLRKICNEIFGEENFISCILWKRKKEISSDSKNVAIQGEYILAYSKSNSITINNENLSIDYIEKSYKNPTKEFPDGKWRPVPITVSKGLSGGGYEYLISTPGGKEHNRLWAYPEKSYNELLNKNRVYFGSDLNGVPQRVIYAHESIGQPTSNYWDNTATNKEGKKEILELFDGLSLFDTPKPTKLLKRLSNLIINKNDIILDFFSGSCSTAHAVLDLNKEDGGNRKFIMVQLPEPCDEKSEAFKAGYKTIADIGKERIRRVIKKIETEVQEEEIKNKGKLELEENKQKNKLDLGFKVFKLDRSNFKNWDGDTENDGIQNQLEKALFHIDINSSEEDILTEILLKSGFQLTVKMEEITLAAKKVFSIADGSLIVCLDKDITKELIQEIAKLEPARVVCLDSGFKERDELKTNAIQIMKSHGVDDFRTV
jgi:adenine-specific DNA-methyltransferase